MTDASAIRVCTWNVHGWCDARGHLAFDRALKTLRAMDCDVVALQEVCSTERLVVLGEALGAAHAFAPAAFCGNALLSRAAMTEHGALDLDARGGELRSAVRARLSLLGASVTVLATHLDVYRESVRCAQYGSLAGALARDEPALLLGDFNALRPDDYDPRRRSEIAAQRRAAGLDAPSDALMTRLDDDGWYDLVRVASRGDSLDGYAASLREPLSRALSVTSRFGTRVDYVFANAALLRRFAVTSCFVGDGSASDHRPVVVSLSARA